MRAFVYVSRSACVASAMIGFVLCAATVRAADESEELAALLKRHAESIVTVKCVTKLELSAAGGGGDQDIETEVSGVMIDPHGLVLCSNTQLGGVGGIMSRMLRGNVPGLRMSSEIKSMQVIWGPDDEELEAKLLARDPILDLAWVQIEKSDREFPALQIAESTNPTLGMHLVGIHRLEKYFDRAPALTFATVCAEATKPRRLWAVQEDVSSDLGLPLFTRGGQLVGFVVVQMPDPSTEGGGGNPLAMLRNLSTLGGRTGMILPVADVVKATARAREEKSDEADE